MELKKKKGYHRHHIIPRHMGGDDSKENLVYLTPAEHAQAHLELYEKYGKYEDAMAYNQLFANVESGFTLDGYKQSEEHIKKRIASMDYEEVSNKLKGRPSPTKGMKFGRPSDETIEKIKQATTGKSKDNSKGLMGQYWKGKKKHVLCCIGCQQPVSPSRINRHGKCFKEYSSRTFREV